MMTKKAVKIKRKLARASMLSAWEGYTPYTEGRAPEDMTWKDAQKDPRFIELSEGNEKLKPTKAVRFLLFNLPSIVTCPYATPDCVRLCYADGAERYPNTLVSRYHRLYLSGRVDFVARMVFSIRAYLNRPVFKGAKKIVVRIHESGDFYSRRYAEKWLEIAKGFLNDSRVVFMAYTKSIRFFEGLEVPDNFTLRYSIWDDTAPEELKRAEALGLPTYSAVDRFTDDIAEHERCRCSDCATCMHCMSGKFHRILCEIH